MAYELLTAFFEAGFLGVMLFGISKVGARLHFAARLMVALGDVISAFWIISVNCWMRTTQGYVLLADGRFVPGPSSQPIIFNPSFPYPLARTVVAAYLTTAFVVGGVAAWHLLRLNVPSRAGPRTESPVRLRERSAGPCRGSNGPFARLPGHNGASRDCHPIAAEFLP